MIKLVRVKESTYQKLVERGKWADTMDDIIRQLLENNAPRQRTNVNVKEGKEPQ